MNSDKVLRAEEFARRGHVGQVRKGAAQEPYTVHLEEVAAFVESEGGSESAVCAAWLHDTVEDCPPTSFKDIEAEFGNVVADIVRELTDDRSLDKAERKRMQIINAAHKSDAACLVKIADKTSNLRSLANSPPTDWDYQRRSDYVIWAAKVVGSLAHQPKGAIQKFLSAVDAAKIANAQNCLSTGQAQAVALKVLQGKALRAGATPEQTKQFLAQFLADTLINNQLATESIRQPSPPHLDAREEAKPSLESEGSMRFFLMEGSTPAIETSPGVMLTLGDDGSWGPVKASEVLNDERSPEVSRDVVASLSARLGASMPDGI